MQTPFPLTRPAYAQLPAPAWLESFERPRTEADERKLDQVLSDSFPASDPPPWTLGRLRPEPIADTPTAPTAPPRPFSFADGGVWTRQTTEVIVGGSRTFRQRVSSGIGALGVGLLIPVGILAVGLPIAVFVRAVLEAVAWLAH